MGDELSIWERLGIPNPDEEQEEPEDEEFEDIADEEEEEAAEENAIARKLGARVDDLEKKFEIKQVEQRKKDFLAEADEIAAELFKAVASEIKDVATLDKTMAAVLKRAEALRAKQEELEEEAKSRVQKAYGVRPGNASASVPTEDEWEAKRARARSGDKHAAYELFRDAAASKKVSHSDG